MSRSNPATTHGNAGIAAWNFKMHAQVHSYADAQRAMELLGKDGFAPIGPHMTLIHEGHDLDPDQAARTYAVELYSTKIIRYYPDGTFSVSNGGHPTPTTRERLQAVIPDGFQVTHCKRQLGLYNPGGALGPHSRPASKLDTLLDAAEAVLDSDYGAISLGELATALHAMDPGRDHRAEYPYVTPVM